MALGPLSDVTSSPCLLLRHTGLCGGTQTWRIPFLRSVSEVSAMFALQVLPGLVPLFPPRWTRIEQGSAAQGWTSENSGGI